MFLYGKAKFHHWYGSWSGTLALGEPSSEFVNYCNVIQIDFKIFGAVSHLLER